MSEILSLKNKLDNHFDVLLDSVKNCSNDEPDILIITEEGNKIFTQRLLLYLYSPMMAGVLAIYYKGKIIQTFIDSHRNQAIWMLSLCKGFW